MNLLQLDIDPRDIGEHRDTSTLIGTKGEAVLHALTAHIPGVTLRATVYRDLHDQIAGMYERHPDRDPKGRRLCRVEHVEDIDLWQVPHTGRRELQRAIRALERRHRRPVVVIHGWQHLSPCPDSSTGRTS